MRGLDLTAEQREQARRSSRSSRAPSAPAEADRAAHEALRKAAVDPNADVRALADAVGKAHADAAVLRVETMRRVVALLTPEQRQKLEQGRSRQGGSGRG